MKKTLIIAILCFGAITGKAQLAPAKMYYAQLPVESWQHVLTALQGPNEAPGNKTGKIADVLLQQLNYQLVMEQQKEKEDAVSDSIKKAAGPVVKMATVPGKVTKGYTWDVAFAGVKTVGVRVDTIDIITDDTVYHLRYTGSIYLGDKKISKNK